MNKRTLMIAGGFLVALLAALFLLWAPDTGGDVAVIDPITGQPIARSGAPDAEGLVRSPEEKARRRAARRARRGGSASAPGTKVSDTAPNGEDDTGVTREMLIDEMIEDVANDTGMDDEAKAHMEEALLRVRDEAAAAAAQDAP